MPEEKKESFTFSDKIKNSKPAGSKSFAKSSSKIGRDGKPRQTLFERTRRDAPFFIAALIALLLLPFLYKFSGQSSEEQLLSPVSEESAFDPERYGFDTAAMVEDPDGQIAQLAGRDSLSLIKGWGSEEEDYGRDDMDFDASASAEYDAEGRYDAEHASRTDIDEEENITNIYKRRARAGTRAAFRRTQIGSLNPASLRRPGGSRLGINNWGGGLKNAAKKVRDDKPRNAPKPVSLQPLRAVSPARSSFGQGAGAAARKSRENLGKFNPREALRDAYVKPVGPTRTGGVDLFADGRFGGGGKLDRNINIAPGREPWWWDMMKTRMQKEWEARFERKWDWIKFFDKLAQNILAGLLNCLITGDSDGDVDFFLGASGESSNEPTCCGWTAKRLDPEKLKMVDGDVKRYCDSKVWRAELKAAGANCDRGFKGGVSVKGKRGPIAQRLCCLGICGSAYASGELGLRGTGALECDTMPHYQVTPSGEARKWRKHIYIYVVARNYFPDSLKNKLNLTGLPTSGKNLLCTQADRNHGGDSLDMTGVTSSGVASAETAKGHHNAIKQHIMEQKAKTANVPTEQEELRERVYEVDQESLSDACVIYVQRGDTFDYEVFKNLMIDRFKEMGGRKITDEDAQEAFKQLDLFLVESFISKYKLAYSAWFESGNQLKNMLPMPYWRFHDAYVRHRKITHKKDGSRDKVYKAKYRVEGVDTLYGPVCYFDNLHIDCGPEDARTATVHFNQVSFGGGNKQVKPNPEENFTVSAEFRYLTGKPGVTQPMIRPMKKNDYEFEYRFDRMYESDAVKNVSEALKTEGLVGNIIWTVKRGEQVVTKECPLNTSGDGFTRTVQEKECKSAQDSEDCCDKIMGNTPHHWDASKPADSRCVDDTPQPPAPQTPAAPSGEQTRLAPVLSWVPSTGSTDCREPAGDEKNPSEDVFKKCPKVPGISRKDENHCASQLPIMMDSEAAARFVRDVVKQYNNDAKPAQPLSDKFHSNIYPTDGEFVDALFIADKLGITQVPSSAVCELARDMVRMSKDKHAGNMVVEANQDFKRIHRYYRNELGAFLVYVHPTSILYPNKFYGKEKVVCDWRFLPKGSVCVTPSKMHMGKAYYFNYYNDSRKNANLQSYLGSFDIVGIKKTYPLAELVQGHSDLPHNCPTDNCASTRETYNKDNGFGLMISDEDQTDGQGLACVAFAGNRTMSVKKAIEYVQNVCETGLDAKPYGNQSTTGKVADAAAKYDPNQTFTSTTTSRPGNTTGTQKQSGGRGRG